MVPFSSATTRFGSFALISDCAPMMLRVRPAQLTITCVFGSGASSRAPYSGLWRRTPRKDDGMPFRSKQTLETWIEGIGTIRNRLVAPAG